MDSIPTFLSDLPPLKRLRLQHQHHQQLQQQLQHHISDSSPLPAKKRREPRNAAFNLNPPPSPPSFVAVYSLPAKKRICAFQPHFSASSAVSPFDLNVKYDSFLEPVENTSNTQVHKFTESPHKPHKLTESLQKLRQVVQDNDGEGDDCDDDDGILCCVCRSTDGDPTDPIVLCDGCDLMVHASCYGNPLSKGIPEGDWFCERCRFSNDHDDDCDDSNKGSSCSCCLCPVKEGALKRTKDNRWAHIVCALLVPEVFFLDPVGREGIDCSKVPKKRWLERCYVCNGVDGCAIVCSEPNCCLAFHVTCGINDELCIEYKQGKKGATVVAGFCKTHSRLWEKLQHSGKYKIVAIEDK